MKYGSIEYQYAAPIARSLVEDAKFRRWVLSKSKFSSSSDARILSTRRCEPTGKIQRRSGGGFTLLRGAVAPPISLQCSQSVICLHIHGEGFHSVENLVQLGLANSEAAAAMILNPSLFKPTVISSEE
jgi:hypothetical protein